MDFAFSEEQEQLRKEARAFLAKESPTSRVRKLMDTEDAFDEGLWKKLVDNGWTALCIPEEYGGFGSFLDLAVVLEEVVPGGAGKAEMRGTSWNARTTGRATLAKGQRCRIERIEGLTLWLVPE